MRGQAGDVSGEVRGRKRERGGGVGATGFPPSLPLPRKVHGRDINVKRAFLAQLTFSILCSLRQVWSLAIDEKRHILFSGGDDWEISSWLLPSCKPSRKIRAHTGPVRSLLVQGDVIFSGSADCHVRVHSLVSGGLPLPLGAELKHTG